MIRFKEKVFCFGPVWDNENPQDEENSSTTPKPSEEGGDQETFTKNEVQQMMEQSRKQHADSIRSLQEKLSSIQVRTQKSETEREGLLAQLEAMRQESMTKEELAREEAERQEKEYSQRLEGAEESAKIWKSRYRDQAIDSAILSEVGADAYNPNQFLSLIKPNAELVNVLDDEGNDVGQFEVKIKMEDLHLSVSEAISRMKEKPEEFGNLFKSGVKGGIGIQPDSSQGVSLETMKNSSSGDWEQHRKQLGLK